MTTDRTDIPPCRCAEIRASYGLPVEYQDGYLACLRHPNASFGGGNIEHLRSRLKIKPGKHPNSLANLDHWHEVHGEEWERRKHLRDDEEPEQKAWHRR